MVPAPQAEQAPAPPAPDPAPRVSVPQNELARLKPGTWIPGDQVGQTLGYATTRSPDGKWWAEVAGPPIGTQTLVVSPADRARAWVVEPNYTAYGDTRPQWTDRNTLIYYSQYGGEHSDSWFEVNPAAGTITPFLPDILKGKNGGRVLFSPDGKRLLASTGYCNGCNKPSELAVTTYLVDLNTGTVSELGVDVEATWNGDEVKLVKEEPHWGYSGPIFGQPSGELRRPIAEGIQIGATDYVEWRAYRLNATSGEAPFKVIPAVDRTSSYNTWDIWWPDPPAEPFRLEAWALVRPGVPEMPAQQKGRLFTQDLRMEGGKRWAVVFSRELTLTSGEPPRQTVALGSLHMWDVNNGWATDWRGRIMRTDDGGKTWRDVSPAGLERCAGRYAPRYTREFGPNTGTVAMACDSTGPDGKWSGESGKVSIFRSVNGGKTWVASYIDTAYTHASPASLQFVDSRNGWAVVGPQPPWLTPQSEGALYRTADGGRSWQKVTNNATGLPTALDIRFLDSRRGWAVGPKRNSLWITEDGGATWREQQVESTAYAADWGRFTAPTFLTADEGYLTAGGGYIEGGRLGRKELYWTNDAGRTWEKRSEWDGERRPVFLTPEAGYIWEYETRSVKWTHDGGRTWEARVWENNQAGVEDVHFIDEQHGYALQGRIWRTTDSAATWTEVYPQAAQ